MRRPVALIVAAAVAVVVVAAPVSAAPPNPPTPQQVTQAQYVLTAHGYAGVGPVDGILGPQTRHAVALWQHANGLVEDGIPGPVTLASLIGSVPVGGASGGAPAQRLNPPAPAPTAAPQTVEDMIRAVWPPEFADRAVRIAYRESRFQPHVRTWCCYGIFQIHRQHLARLGLTSVDQLYDPLTNVVAAYHLYQLDGWGPWAT